LGAVTLEMNLNRGNLEALFTPYPFFKCLDQGALELADSAAAKTYQVAMLYTGLCLIVEMILLEAVLLNQP
jgi:hypothetical protein